MAEKQLPNHINAKSDTGITKAQQNPNQINDPQVMLQLRKNRHLSGLMCPPMGIPVYALPERKSQRT